MTSNSVNLTKEEQINSFDSSYLLATIWVLVLCSAAGLILNYFSLNSPRWNFITGLLIIIVVDVIVCKYYHATTQIISNSNFFACVINLVIFTLIYIAINEEAAVNVEHILLVNLGLLVIAICWILAGFVKFLK
ncbi:MAG: hypothetical protein IJU48_10855 [Synergistaceae bacterium]|nr:hypothetical protein [Synergistaceae bacterium]